MLIVWFLKTFLNILTAVPPPLSFCIYLNVQGIRGCRMFSPKWDGCSYPTSSHKKRGKEKR